MKLNVKYFLCVLVVVIAMFGFGGCKDEGAAQNLAAAENAFDSGAFGEAAEYYEKAFLEEPNSVEALRGLIACLEKSGENGEENSHGEENSRRLMKAYEALLSITAAEQSEYMALALLYEEAKDYLGLRNTLEEANRLYPSLDNLEELEKIVLEVSEAEPLVMEASRKLMNHIASGNNDMALELMLSEDWYGEILPKIREGRRRYTDKNEEAVLKLMVGYDKNGARQSFAWYLKPSGELIFLRAQEDMLSEGRTIYQKGAYNGEFNIKCYLLPEGDAFEEVGTFKDNKPWKSIESKVCFGKKNISDIYEFYRAGDSLNYVKYNGSFDGEGKSTEKQQPKARSEGWIIYAYDAALQKYLYIEADNKSSSEYSFTCGDLGFTEYPQW